MVREVREKGGSKNEVKSVNLKIEVSYYVTNHVHSIYKTLITFISQTNTKFREFSIADRIF